MPTWPYSSGAGATFPAAASDSDYPRVGPDEGLSRGRRYTALLCDNPHHRQRKAQPQFVPEEYLHVVEAELLELHATEIVDVGRVAFHFLQFKLDLRLSDYLLFVDADDARFLPEFSQAAAPARPDAEPHVIDRELRRGNDVQRHRPASACR